MKYALSSRIIHWIMAALIIFMLALGLYMSDMPKDAVNRMEIYGLHKSLGALALILIIVRIVNRFIFKAPALPDSFPKVEKVLAHLGHIALYLLMIIAPLSGYLMSNSFGYPVSLFALQMPFLIGTNLEMAPFFKEAHEISTTLLMIVIAIHIAAVVKHRFFDKAENDVLKRML